MEFNYLALGDLVVGENNYNWEPLEHLLDDIASRHKQAIFVFGWNTLIKKMASQSTSSKKAFGLPNGPIQIQLLSTKESSHT